MSEELRLDVVTVAHSKGLTDAARDVKALKGETDQLNDSTGAASHASDDLTKSLDKEASEAASVRAEVKKLNDEVERTAKVGVGGGGPVPISPGKSDKLPAVDMSFSAQIARSREYTAEIARQRDAIAAQINTSRAAIRALEDELTKTGNNPGLRKALRAERSWLNDLNKIGKDLTEDAVRFGLQSADQFTGSFTQGLSGLGQYAIPALIGAGVLLSPVIGGILSGAVLGAVGVGGIAGGIAAAATDGSVKEAWQNFTSTLTADDFGKQAFIEPVKQGIGELKAGFESLHIGDVLSKGAVAVPILAAGVAQFANNVMPGFNAVMSKAEDIANIFSDGLGDVGASLSSLLYDVAHSQGSFDGLRTIFSALALGIRSLGNVLGFASDAYRELLRENEAITRANAKMYAGVPVLGNAYASVNQKIREWLGVAEPTIPIITGIGQATVTSTVYVADFGSQLDLARKSALAYQDSLVELEKQQLAMDSSTLAWKQDVLDLTTSVKEHGHSTADNTQEGLKNQQMIQGLIGDAIRMADAKKAETGSQAEANKVYNDQIAILEALLAKLGFTKQQIDALVGNHYVNVVVAYTTTGNAAQINKNLRAEDLAGRAEGGPVMAGVPYRINERGYETVTFPASATVHPAHLTPMMSSGGAGGGTQTFQLTYVPSGVRLVDALMEMLRIEVQGLGGPVAAFA